MSYLTPEKRAELRELIGESPDLPYRVSHGTHGNPSDGPTYVALEALWDGRWEEVATGDYASWNGIALDLAAAAVNALPALLAAADERDRLAAQVERVREVAERYDADARHEPYGGELWSTTAAAINAALSGEPA